MIQSEEEALISSGQLQECHFVLLALAERGASFRVKPKHGFTQQPPRHPPGFLGIGQDLDRSLKGQEGQILDHLL